MKLKLYYLLSHNLICFSLKKSNAEDSNLEHLIRENSTTKFMIKAKYLMQSAN